MFAEQAFGRDLLATIEVAPPALLPAPGPRGHVRGNRGFATFLNSRGEVTCYSPAGDLEWQVRYWLYRVATCLHEIAWIPSPTLGIVL